MMVNLATVFLLLQHVIYVETSFGDQSNEFQDCVNFCANWKCKKFNSTLPWYLTMLFWTCEDDCRYKCMMDHTTDRLSKGLHVLQYHGKWPFKRVLGVQEPASAVFSGLNAAVHVAGWFRYKECVSSKYEFFPLTQGLYIVNVLGWLSSFVFHVRDKVWTERLDYTGANLIMATSLILCLARICGKVWHTSTLLCTIAVLSLFAHHFYSMNFVRMDYGYNTKFMASAGVANVVLWLVWCAMHRKQRPYVWKCATALTLGLTLAGLELGDFPPIWWTFDAHSLWHLGTVPLTYLWYRFLIDDALWEIRLQAKTL